ncbi:MAG: ABC transporter ATP-binding protein [Mycobacteriaceae bacterium]|nr:ABC transporter ATP-binding protein [Mycobacteriaceae bacterium]
MMNSSKDELFSASANPAISIKNLQVIRGKSLAVQNVSAQIGYGTITGLLGPSGCGKTTLIRCIVGTQALSGGSVLVLGHPAGSKPLRQRIGYMPQDPTVYNDLKVIDNIRYFAALYGVDSRASEAALATVDLTGQRNAYCGNLSGGQRARASLACALVGQPDLLVLDEPTIGLDPVLRYELWETFARLAATGVTLLVSSHVMDEAEHCTNLLLMRDARLLAHTTPHQLREDTGCASLEKAFLSIIRTTTAPAAG